MRVNQERIKRQLWALFVPRKSTIPNDATQDNVFINMKYSRDN
jgi:hypothetical protein